MTHLLLLSMQAPQTQQLRPKHFHLLQQQDSLGTPLAMIQPTQASMGKES